MEEGICNMTTGTSETDQEISNMQTRRFAKTENDNTTRLFRTNEGSCKEMHHNFQDDARRLSNSNSTFHGQEETLKAIGNFEIHKSVNLPTVILEIKNLFKNHGNIADLDSSDLPTGSSQADEKCSDVPTGSSQADLKCSDVPTGSSQADLKCSDVPTGSSQVDDKCSDVPTGSSQVDDKCSDWPIICPRMNHIDIDFTIGTFGTFGERVHSSDIKFLCDIINFVFYRRTKIRKKCVVEPSPGSPFTPALTEACAVLMNRREIEMFLIFQLEFSSPPYEVSKFSKTCQNSLRALEKQPFCPKAFLWMCLILSNHSVLAFNRSLFIAATIVKSYIQDYLNLLRYCGHFNDDSWKIVEKAAVEMKADIWARIQR